MDLSFNRFLSVSQTYTHIAIVLFLWNKKFWYNTKQIITGKIICLKGFLKHTEPLVLQQVLRAAERFKAF